MKNNIHKKVTFEDKFDRRFACWVHNHSKNWAKEKRRVRKSYRIKLKLGTVDGEKL